MIRTMFAAALLAAALAPEAAFATGPLPGVNINLGQVPGGIVASAATDSAGTVSFFNLPAGSYQVIIDNSKLTTPAVAAISVGRGAPIQSDPIAVAAGRGASSGSYASGNGGRALTLVITPGSGAPGGANKRQDGYGLAPRAKPQGVSGPAPRDAKPDSIITVTLTAQSKITKGR